MILPFPTYGIPSPAILMRRGRMRRGKKIKSRAWFGDWRANDESTAKVTDIPEYTGTNESRRQNRGTVQNSDTGWNIRISREGETNTISHSGVDRLSEYGLAGIRGLVENGVLLDSEVHEHHSNNAKNDMIAFDHKLYALGQDGSGNVALYKITVEERFQDPYNTNERKFHNLKYIEKVAEVPADANVEQSHKDGSTMEHSTTAYTVSDILALVKQFDKDFTPAREVSPEMLNGDGTPNKKAPSVKLGAFLPHTGNEGEYVSPNEKR